MGDRDPIYRLKVQRSRSLGWLTPWRKIRRNGKAYELITWYT